MHACISRKAAPSARRCRAHPSRGHVNRRLHGLPPRRPRAARGGAPRSSPGARKSARLPRPRSSPGCRRLRSGLCRVPTTNRARRPGMDRTPRLSPLSVPRGVLKTDLARHTYATPLLPPHRTARPHRNRRADLPPGPGHDELVKVCGNCHSADRPLRSADVPS